MRPDRSLRSRRRHGERGIQDVIGTIIILAIAVILAGIVTIWVNTYPIQNPNRTDVFALNLTYGGSTCVLSCGGGGGGGGGGGPVFATSMTGIRIQLVAGPRIDGTSVVQSSVRLASQQVPSAFAAPFTLAAGLAGSSSWSPGQTWTLNLTSYGLPFFDNLTVIVDSGNQLVLNSVLPGPNPVSAPYFTSATAAPSTVAHGSNLLVTCAIVAPDGLNASNPPALVSVNLTEINKGTKLFKPLTLANGFWSVTYAVPSTQSAGTYFIFITAVDNFGIASQVAVQVVVT
ncbi:MAG TPA: archaellin/type IV pilin N-terminal domain-containing protein [Thermoplasmata archaeon]|nr:archaellin/type IV pilin N-terminal domain-containing protein [Thermoplasmata archaeon]